MAKDKSIRSRGSLPLDLTPEEMAAHILTYYVDCRVQPDSQAEYIRRYVTEVLERVPEARNLLASDWLTELCEEVVRRAPSTEAHYIVKLIEQIEAAWRQEG